MPFPVSASTVSRELRDSGSMYLSGLVLSDLVLGVLSAVLALAVGASCLWNVDLEEILCQYLFG
jgi:hypothetical protein